jgi:hypothetical protein
VNHNTRKAKLEKQIMSGVNASFSMTITDENRHDWMVKNPSKDGKIFSFKG